MKGEIIEGQYVLSGREKQITPYKILQVAQYIKARNPRGFGTYEDFERVYKFLFREQIKTESLHREIRHLVKQNILVKNVVGNEAMFSVL